MKHFVSLFSIIASTFSFAAPPSMMQDGLWEITSRTEIVGRPESTPPVTSRACYTKQDVESVNAVAPKDEKCEISDYKHQGNNATWNITCTGKGNITGHGSVTFHSRSTYSGTVKLRLQQEGHAEIQMNNDYSGKRIGDCSQ